MAENKKAPAGVTNRLLGPRWMIAGQLEQVEFLGATNGRPTVVDS